MLSDLLGEDLLQDWREFPGDLADDALVSVRHDPPGWYGSDVGE